MAIVKLALSGLDGVESSQVKIGSARVTYDPARITPRQIVAGINDKTSFKARLAGGGASFRPTAHRGQCKGRGGASCLS